MGAATSHDDIAALSLSEAALARIERLDAALHAFVHIEREDALARAREIDGKQRRGKASGPLRGIPMAHKDMYYRGGQGLELRFQDQARVPPGRDGDCARAPRPGGRNRSWRARHGRVRHGPPRLQHAPAALPQYLELRAHPVRLVVRFGYRCGGPARLRRARLRYRRLHPLPGRGERRGRHQPDPGPCQPLRRDADVVVPRRDGPARPHGARLRPRARRDRRHR